jgi:hypothetical protein
MGTTHAMMATIDTKETARVQFLKALADGLLRILGLRNGLIPQISKMLSGFMEIPAWGNPSCVLALSRQYACRTHWQQ